SIPAGAVASYQTILATGGLRDDFPRAKLGSSWELVQALKPTFNATQSLAEWDSFDRETRRDEATSSENEESATQ
ncbi:unnamed protein product, partial [Rhizoctonia solani]